MGRRLIAIGRLALGLLALGGCGDDTGVESAGLEAGVLGGPSLDGGQALTDAGRDASVVAAGGTVTITGHVNGGLFTMVRPAVQVCVHEPAGFGCVDTDEIGLYSIEAPADAQVALLIEGEGLTPTLRVFLTSEEDLELGNTRVASLGALSGVAAELAVELDPDKGAIFFSGIEFVSAQLVPPSGQRYFIDAAGRLLEGAEWLEVRGSGGFLNVEPGLAAIRFARPHIPCAFNRTNTQSGWPDPDDYDVAVVPVLAGHHVSVITMDCGSP